MGLCVTPFQINRSVLLNAFLEFTMASKGSRWFAKNPCLKFFKFPEPSMCFNKLPWVFNQLNGLFQWLWRLNWIHTMRKNLPIMCLVSYWSPKLILSSLYSLLNITVDVIISYYPHVLSVVCLHCLGVGVIRVLPGGEVGRAGGGAEEGRVPGPGGRLQDSQQHWYLVIYQVDSCWTSN